MEAAAIRGEAGFGPRRAHLESQHPQRRAREQRLDGAALPVGGDQAACTPIGAHIARSGGNSLRSVPSVNSNTSRPRWNAPIKHRTSPLSSPPHDRLARHRHTESCGAIGGRPPRGSSATSSGRRRSKYRSTHRQRLTRPARTRFAARPARSPSATADSCVSMSAQRSQPPGSFTRFADLLSAVGRRTRSGQHRGVSVRRRSPPDPSRRRCVRWRSLHRATSAAGASRRRCRCRRRIRTAA